MDPLSITFSVITLLELTKKIIIFAKQTRDASTDRTRVLQEASSLTGLLSTLKDLIDDPDRGPHDPWLRATSGLAAPDGPLHQYKLTLERVVTSVMPDHGSSRVKRALTWNLGKEEVTCLLSQIERVKALIHIALEIDDMFVSSFTSWYALSADCNSTLMRAIHADSHKIHNGLADLKTTTSAIVDTTVAIRNHTTFLQDDTTTRRKRELLKWICPADYYEQHCDYIDKRQSDTGEWFLQDAKFQEWMESEQSTLFCPGIPGAGKTMMAALVIDRLLRSKHAAERPVVFIYCNYKRQDEQSIKHLLSSLLRQVIDIQEGIPKSVQDFYTFHARKRTTPSNREVERILVDVARDLLGLTVLVDGLDECESQTCLAFVSVVEVLRKRCKVRLLATSRYLPDIQSHATFRGEPVLEVRASDQDVEKYVRLRAGAFCSPVASKPDIFESLVSSIVNVTGGM